MIRSITKLRFEHLRQCVGNHESRDEQDFLKHLTHLLNLIANASLPATFMRVLGGSILIALHKPGGSPGDVRPIAMGEVYRKLTSSLLVTKSQQKIDTILGKLQLGVGIKCGVEKIIHLTSAWFSQNAGDIVLIDFSNAFNSVSRDVAFDNFKTRLPELYPYVHAIYGDVPSLWFNLENNYSSISSSQGAQQGDPLGPLLFALATIPWLEDLQRQLHDGFVQAYIDDITQLASFEAQCRAIQSLRTLAPKYGLAINFRKFKILQGRCGSAELAATRRQHYQQLCPGILDSNIVTNPEDDQSYPADAYGLEILGSPVGSPAFVRNYLRLYVTNTLRQEMSRLDKVTHLQTLWCYIHYVVNSKITHLLRTIPPAYTDEFIRDFRDLQIQLTQRAFDIPHADSDDEVLHAAFHDDMCQSQLSLPIASGGLGLRYYADICQSAYLASVICCRTHLSSLPDWTLSAPYFSAQAAYDYWAVNGEFPRTADLKPHNNLEEWLIHPDNIAIFDKPHLQKQLTTGLNLQRIQGFKGRLTTCTRPSTIIRCGSIDPLSFLSPLPSPCSVFSVFIASSVLLCHVL